LKEAVDEIIQELKSIAKPANLAGMKRFGIDATHALGVSIPALRALAKHCGKNHALAVALWKTGIHEARILASMVDEPAKVTAAQIDSWVKDFNSWDICDQVCGNLFDRTKLAVAKAKQFSKSKHEYIKRAGFTLMAEYAVHDKAADDKIFISFLPIIEREAWDERNFVKKAVNWALRGIGKRNKTLNTAAIRTAKNILLQDSKAAKWIAGDALRELQSEAVKRKFGI